MEKETLNVAIVGSVDHGKSTLIGRLLYDTGMLSSELSGKIKKEIDEAEEVEFAFVLDAFQEERDQNITIDTTQRFFETEKRRYVIIDTPGHKEFLKNMITGASHADVAVLIIDAKEGVREQTKRHLNILAWLGINQIIVVINKMDLVNYSQNIFDSINLELKNIFLSLNIEQNFVIPISAKRGENITMQSSLLNFYKGLPFVETLDGLKIEAENADTPLRMPVQDIYKVNCEAREGALGYKVNSAESGREGALGCKVNCKKIIVGRVESGEIKKGDGVVVLPNGQNVKIETIEVFGENLDKANCGDSVGVTISGALEVVRGDMISSIENPPIVSDSFIGKIFWFSDSLFLEGERLVLKLNTQNAECNIEKIINKINSSTLDNIGNDLNCIRETEMAEVLIRTKSPVVFDDFYQIKEMGRFILSREGEIVAGGVIISGS